MSRGYTNKKGETIKFSNEELDILVEIKLELQKASPSMRCNWSQLVKMAKEEGIDGTENSENFRCLIKAYQKSKGSLPSSTKHAEIVSDNKLQSIKEAVGELAWQKREVQNEARQLGKIKREVIDNTILIEEIGKAIREEMRSMSFEKMPPSPTQIDGTRMILCLSDWHIGALVDTKNNKYNSIITESRIRQTITQAIKVARENGVEHIDVVAMGDFIEGSFMRASQGYGIEFPTSQQMARAGRLVIELLVALSECFSVTYSGFSGNHDRMNQSDKNGNIDGDSAMVVVNEMVKVFVDAASIKGLKYRQAVHNYHDRLLDVNGRNFRFEHGDLVKKADTGKLADRSTYDGIQYDAIVYGHFHHFMVLDVGLNKYEIRVGSPKGSDEYSEKLGLASAPSQALILVDGNGKIDVRKIGLK